MADDVLLNAGSGGDTTRAKQKGTPKTQVTILDVSGSGTEDIAALGGVFRDAVQQAQSLTLTSTANAVTLTTLHVYNTVTVHFTAWGTGGSAIFEGSVDGGTTWVTLPAVPVNSTGAPVTTVSATGIWQVDTTGFNQFRVRVNTTGTGSSTVSMRATAAQVTNVTSIVPGYGPTNLGKREDDPAVTGDTGVAVLAVRRDQPQSDVSAAGDYATLLSDAIGQLWVRDDNVTRLIISSGVTLTLATTAYTAGDQVGSTYYTMTGMSITTGGSGWIRGAWLFDVKGIIGAYTMFVFRDTVTLAADNAAFTLNTAGDGDKFVGAIPTGPTYTLGTPHLGVSQALAIPYTCVGTSLYVALRTEVGHSFFTASTDLHVGLIVDIES